jgi:hypothetical protein
MAAIGEGAAQHRLAADGGRWDHEPLRLKPGVRPTTGRCQVTGVRNRCGRVWLSALLLPGCLLAFCMSAPVGASEPRSDGRPDGTRETRRFGPFLTASGGYIVNMDYVRRPAVASGRADEPTVATLANVTVVDQSGRTVYERALDYNATASGFDPERTGTAYELRAESGIAIVIEVGTIKRDQPVTNTTGWMIALVQHAEGLQLAAPEIRFYGSLEHFPGPPLGPRRLVAGDLMRTREWTGHYSFIPGFRANFRTATISPLCAKKCTWGVVVEAQPLGSSVCRLAARPLGPTEAVVVRADSRVEYLDAYIEDMERYDRDSDDPASRPWLHVRLDGREGWVTEAPDLAAVGLPYSR